MAKLAFLSLFLLLVGLLLCLVVRQSCAHSIPSSEKVRKPNCSSIYECVCGDVPGDDAYAGQVDCAGVNGTVKVSFLSCVTYDITRDIFVAGTCPFSKRFFASKVRSKYKLRGNFSTPEEFNDKVMCKQMGRTGRLCGHCNHRLSVAFNSYSFRCVPSKSCHTYDWLVVLVANLVPVTIFFVVIIVFHIRIMSGYANAFILFAQVISMQINVISLESTWISALPKHHRNAVPSRVALSLVAFYSIWSLELGRCLTPRKCSGGKFGMAISFLFQYITALYCLVLIITLFILIELHARNVRLVVWLWKPFRVCFSRFRRHLDPKASIIDAFATFLVLAYSKFAVVSIMLLTPTGLYSKEGTRVGWALLYDGTLDYFGKHHSIVAAAAIPILIVFGILPPILLLLYPLQCVQRFLNRYRLHKPALVTFMDAFQGCYKDGTNGTRDRRFFSAMYLIIRLIVFPLYVIMAGGEMYPLLQLAIHILAAIFALLVAILRPYKNNSYNNFDTAMLVFIGVVTTLCTYSWINHGRYLLYVIILHVILSVPLLISVGYVFLHLCVFIRARQCVRSLIVSTSNWRQPSHCSRVLSRNESKSEIIAFPDRLLRPERYNDQERGELKHAAASYGSM